MRPPTSARRGFLAVALAAFATLGLTAGNSDAAYTIKLFREFSGSGTPSTTADNPYATIKFETVAGGVKVTATAESTTYSYNTIRDLYFNLNVSNAGWNPATKVDNLSVVSGGVSVSSADIKFNDRDNPTGNTNFKADGDGFFDVRIELPTGGVSPSTFNAGDSFSFRLVGASLAWVIDLSQGGDDPTKTGFVGAGHITGFTGGGSGWYTGSIYDDDGFDLLGEAVPAPPAVILAVVGVGLFGFVGRRMRRTATA